MSAYLRLLLLRTRRRLLSLALGPPIIIPPALVVAGVLLQPGSNSLLVAWRSGRTSMPGIVEFPSMVTLAAALLACANLTAYFVHDERRQARGRVLRMAAVDGWAPVAAHLAHASLLAIAGSALGLVLPGLYWVLHGPPREAWPAMTLLVAVHATLGGAFGLWLGYFLPRLVSLVLIQILGLAWVEHFAGALLAARAVGAWPWPGLTEVAVIQLATIVVLPVLWRRTSGRLW
jgi:hypothetical protein